MDGLGRTFQEIRKQQELHVRAESAWSTRLAHAWLTGFWSGLIVGLSGSVLVAGLIVWIVNGGPR